MQDLLTYLYSTSFSGQLVRQPGAFAGLQDNCRQSKLPNALSEADYCTFSDASPVQLVMT